MGGKSGGSAKTQVTEYRMSLHYGICYGPLDHMSQIVVAEKSAWEGQVSEAGSFTIDNKNLFGGIKKEGGVVGKVTYLPGDDDQVFPEELAAKFGKTSATMPAYRGIASAFFSEISGASRNGFYWTANSPYVRGTWIKVSRSSVGLDPTKAKLFRAGSSTDFDSNGAHMLFECLTNTEWGMGSSASAIDVPSFEGAATTLFNEGFGLSMLWNQQSTIEEFASEILDHINATLFVNPRTGLLTLKLIRDDYDPNALRVFTPSNSTITNFQRKFFGETVNEVVVTWTNPANEQNETVVAQDNANIEIQGGVVSDSRNYYGIRVRELAEKIANRDLRAASTPLASCEIEADRSAWDLLPGEVVKVESPEDNVAQIIMRVGPVDYGRPGESLVRATLVEDVFALAPAEFTSAPPSLWDDPSEPPAPAAFSYVFTLPYYMVVSEISPDVAGEAEYPTVFAGVLAAQTGSDTGLFDLTGELMDAAGNTYSGSLGTKSIASRATLAAPIVAEAQTTITSFGARTQGSGPETGGFVIIGDGAEDEVEIALITAISGEDVMLNRGVLDTIPRAWPDGTQVWFVEPDTLIFGDDEPRSEGETVEYKVLTRTSTGLLAEGDAPLLTATLTGRPHFPFRPAAVAVEGVGFGTVDATALTDIVVTWANRNRLTEDNQVLAWDAASVSPEAGQTTAIELLDAAGELIDTISGISGTEQTIAKTLFGAETSGFIRVFAEREGLRSLQGHEIAVTLSV